MRPPEFTGGNGGDRGLPLYHCNRYSWSASMRPPEFTGGNRVDSRIADVRLRSVVASMRPPEFTGGNTLGSRPYATRIQDPQLQ